MTDLDRLPIQCSVGDFYLDLQKVGAGWRIISRAEFPLDEAKSLKSQLESKLAESDKYQEWYNVAKSVKMEKPEEIKFAKWNSDFWSDFMDNKEIRLITIDGRGDEKFIYTTQNKIIEALQIQSQHTNLVKAIQDLIEVKRRDIERKKWTNPDSYDSEDDEAKILELQNLLEVSSETKSTKEKSN